MQGCETYNSKLMIKTYFKLAFRNLNRSRVFSFINIFGLALGTLCCLYIVVYVEDQFSYDKQHKDATSIYRVTTDLDLTGDRHHYASVSPPIVPVGCIACRADRGAGRIPFALCASAGSTNTGARKASISSDDRAGHEFPHLPHRLRRLHRLP